MLRPANGPFARGWISVEKFGVSIRGRRGGGEGVVTPLESLTASPQRDCDISQGDDRSVRVPVQGVAISRGLSQESKGFFTSKIDSVFSRGEGGREGASLTCSDGSTPYAPFRDLMGRVRRWNEPSDPEGADGPNARFKKAMSLAGGELCSYVQGLAGSWWPARALVAEALARRHDDHPSGEVRLSSCLSFAVGGSREIGSTKQDKTRNMRSPPPVQ